MCGAHSESAQNSMLPGESQKCKLHCLLRLSIYAEGLHALT